MQNVSIIPQLSKKKKESIKGTVIIRAYYNRRPVASKTTGYRILVSDWDTEQQRVKDYAPNAKLINPCIEKKLLELQAELLKRDLTGSKVNRQVLKNIVKGLNPGLDFYKFCRDHIPKKYCKKDQGETLHKRMSNIEFKILEVEPGSIVIRVSQGKHLSENYADKKTLVNRIRELFQPFLPDHKIHPQASAYEPSPVTRIDSIWVKKQMDILGLRVTDIVHDTGIDKTNISAWANGTRSMSQIVKAMFYHYFNSIGQQRSAHH